jgi:predicted Zn-dependent protease
MTQKNHVSAMQYYTWASPFADGGFALASNPNIDVDVGKYHESQLNFEEADRLFRRLDYRVGGNEQTTLLIAHNLQNYAQFEPIDSFYFTRIANNPNWLLVWEDYVGWLKRDGFKNQALLASRAAVSSNPNAKRLRIQLALLELGHGNANDSVDIAKKLVEENKTDPSIWMLYARTLDGAGRREEAQNAVDMAQKLQRIR